MGDWFQTGNAGHVVFDVFCPERWNLCVSDPVNNETG